MKGITLGLCLALATGALWCTTPASAGPLILYIGPPGGEYAAAARSGVTLRLGFTEEEIAGAEPIVEYVFGGAETWPLGGEASLCPRGRDEVSLSHQILIADKAIDEMEFSTAAAALEPVAERLGCVTTDVEVAQLSRAAFLLGYSRFQTGDRDGALEGFKLAAGFKPTIEWDANYPPDAQQVFNSGVLSALRTDEATIAIPDGIMGEGVLEIDGGPIPGDGEVRPGLHQLTIRKRAGGSLRLAVSFPVGETVEMVPVGGLVDGFLVGQDTRETMTDALVDVMNNAGREEVYIVEPDSGRIFRFHAPSRALRLIPGPATPMSVPETPAMRVVERYYAPRTPAPPTEWFDAGVLAAKVLLEQGWTEATLNLAVDQAHELIAGSRTQPFETIVPPLAQQFPRHGARPSDIDVVDAQPDPPPEDPENPDVLPPENGTTGGSTTADDGTADAGTGDTGTATDAGANDTGTATTTDTGGDAAVTDTEVKVVRKGVSKGARAALAIGGTAALLGGMIGGGAATAYYSNLSGYDQPGGIVALGLIPLAGPMAGWGYWTTWGDYFALQPLVGLSVMLTVVEVVGAALIITAAALPKPVELPATGAIREPRRPAPTVVLVPSFHQGGGLLTFAGRF